MFLSLDRSLFSKVRPLFHAMEATQPMVSAVLDGICPGSVYVDDAGNPSTALVVTFLSSKADGVWVFLAGDSSNAAFNHSLNDALYKRSINVPETPVVFLTCDPQDWGGGLRDIFAPRPLVRMLRHHYVCHSLNFAGEDLLPVGFSLRLMSTALLEIPGLELPDDVQKTLAKWRTYASLGIRDFGFVVVDETGEVPVMASWATVDFVSSGCGDLGFFTQPQYRKKGLGTLAAAAAMTHGLVKGLHSIHWSCSADNVGSIRTAKKLGLERLEDYTLAIMVYDELEHLGCAAYYGMEMGDYTSAAGFIDQIFSLSTDLPPYVLYDAARLRAWQGRTQEAFDFLSEAVGKGWRAVADVQTRPEFEKLRNLPGWDEILAKMQG